MSDTGGTAMDKEQLQQILDAHAKWLRGEGGGQRANLADAYLAGACLARANLAGANLAGANLARANLADAYLARANLARANLADADLAGADLADADLAGADLAGADLAGADLADADLAGADLADAYLARADLAGADLADANLAGADLAGARNVPDTSSNEAAPVAAVPVVPDLERKILGAIDAGGSLEMSSWHTCGTTHCLAGWAIHLAGDAGYALEREVGSQRAGTLIYRASCDGFAPHFFAPNERALRQLRERVAKAGGHE